MDNVASFAQWHCSEIPFCVLLTRASQLCVSLILLQTCKKGERERERDSGTVSERARERASKDPEERKTIYTLSPWEGEREREREARVGMATTNGHNESPPRAERWK